MILAEYIDFLKIRLKRYFAGAVVSDVSISNYINTARRKVQNYVLPFMSDRFGNVINIPFNNGVQDPTIQNIQYGTRAYQVFIYGMPADLLSIDNVYMMWQGASVLYKKQCRQSSKREVYTISIHDWNVPTIDSPIFAYEYDVFARTILLYIGATFDQATMTSLTNLNATLQVWYVQALLELTEPTDMELYLSPELQELVILEAIKNLLIDYYPSVNLNLINQELMSAFETLMTAYQLDVQTQVEELSTMKKEEGL